MTSGIPVCDLPNGYWRVPWTKLANATVWMEIRERPAPLPAVPLTLKPVPAANDSVVRSAYRRIGTPCLWDRTSQLLEDERHSPWRPGDSLHFAYDEADRHVGLVELARQDLEAARCDIEISYIGLFPERIGQGLGIRLMAAALELAWASSPRRVHLHTCNTDHPRAFAFYRSVGFVPYAAGVQIMDDPRHLGLLPADAAPHVPFIENPEANDFGCHLGNDT